MEVFGLHLAGVGMPETKTTSVGRMKDFLRSAKIISATGNLKALSTDCTVLPVYRVQRCCWREQVKRTQPPLSQQKIIQGDAHATPLSTIDYPHFTLFPESLTCLDASPAC
jgi:hypothetical protein